MREMMVEEGWWGWRREVGVEMWEFGGEVMGKVVDVVGRDLVF